LSASGPRAPARVEGSGRSYSWERHLGRRGLTGNRTLMWQLRHHPESCCINRSALPPSPGLMRGGGLWSCYSVVGVAGVGQVRPLQAPERFTPGRPSPCTCSVLTLTANRTRHMGE